MHTDFFYIFTEHVSTYCTLGNHGYVLYMYVSRYRRLLRPEPDFVNLLKGQCHKIFCFRFFFIKTSSPNPLKITKGAFSKFFANSRRFSQVKVHHHHHQRHWWCALSCQYLGGLFVKIRNGPYGRWGKLIHE
jgi:hypothetical protein